MESNHIVTIQKNKLYWVSTKKIPSNLLNSVYFCTDKIFIYNPFYNDFGPLSIDKIMLFIEELEKILNNKKKKTIYHYTDLSKENRCNSAFLMGCYMILKMNFSAEDVWKKFSIIKPLFELFRDSHPGKKSSFFLSLKNCFRSFEYSIKMSIFNPKKFDPNDYEFYNNIKNGYLNWIVQNKIIVFSSPCNNDSKKEFYNDMKAEEFIPFFLKSKVKLIIRLNSKTYDKKIFEKVKIKHKDLYFREFTKPSLKIIINFLSLLENTDGVIAIHSRTGLGRAAFLIALALIFIYKFTPEDSIAWMRICRPGSIISYQQKFLVNLKKYVFKLNQNSRFFNSLKPEIKSWVKKFHEIV